METQKTLNLALDPRIQAGLFRARVENAWKIRALRREFPSANEVILEAMEIEGRLLPNDDFTSLTDAEAVLHGFIL